MSLLRRLLRDNHGASAAEFVLVLPLVILLIFGMIDAGRFMWTYNQAEKATQMGVRYAVATNLIPTGLTSYSFATSGGVPAGTTVPNNSGAGTGWFASATCTSSSCTCSGSTGFCSSIGHNSTAFTGLVNRMKLMYSPIGANNVQVEYRNVGLGYAGDPNGPDVAPLVTVRLTGMTYRPLSFELFKGTLAMPDFRAALTLEDGSGNVSN